MIFAPVQLPLFGGEKESQVPDPGTFRCYQVLVSYLNRGWGDTAVVPQYTGLMELVEVLATNEVEAAKLAGQLCKYPTHARNMTVVNSGFRVTILPDGVSPQEEEE